MADEDYVLKEVWDMQCEQINAGLTEIKETLKPMVKMVIENNQRLNDHITRHKEKWSLSQILITGLMALIAVGMLIVNIFK